MTLKEIIEPLHRRAEQMEFTQRMMKGELSAEEYSMYLYQLKLIFNMIEIHELPHPDLGRYDKAQEDMWELESASDDVYMLNMTSKYVDYLSNLSREDIMAHIYVNYMALMYGGQMMKDKVPGSGRVYDFDNLIQCIQSIRDIQHEGWGHEANVGLLYNIAILDELQKLFRLSSQND
jgi:heme oxygenase